MNTNDQWKPCTNIPDESIVAREYTGDVLRVLEIEAGPDGRTRQEQLFILNETAFPVVIHIAEGTSREDAIRSLRAVVSLLESDYASMVDAVPLEWYYRP